jgi:Zn-finger nucleic acid-binding protein
MREEFIGSDGWMCVRCRVSLSPEKTTLSYLNRGFEAELMRCPRCGKVFIGEDLALGKMLEVERSLEDK